ncbi:hypothetical protein HispidOSU_009717 [Sigmodon hispidus]
MLKQKFSPIGEEEAMGPSPKKRCTMDMMSNQPFEASVQVKEEVDTYIPISQVEMMEDDDYKPSHVYPKEWDQEKFKPMVGDSVLPNPQDFLPDDFFDLKDGENITVGIANASLEQATLNAATKALLEAGIYVAPPDPNVINYKIKCALMTEIQRYGLQYGRIFRLLEEVQGPLEVKIQFVKFTIKEAARFKRYHLIHYLEKILDDLMLESTIKIDDF